MLIPTPRCLYTCFILAVLFILFRFSQTRDGGSVDLGSAIICSIASLGNVTFLAYYGISLFCFCLDSLWDGYGIVLHSFEKGFSNVYRLMAIFDRLEGLSETVRLPGC